MSVTRFNPNQRQKTRFVKTNSCTTRKYGRFSTRFHILSELLLVPTFLLLLTPLDLPAQDYTIRGTAELSTVASHYKDSTVVISPLKDTWEVTGDLLLSATHRLSFEQARFVLDHAVEITPAQATVITAAPVGETGSAGTGDPTSAEVDLTHRLYQAFVAVQPATWFTLQAGRQRINWGTAYTFSVTDGIHPHHPDREIQPGFDGVSLAIRPTPDLSLLLNTAIQNAVHTKDTDDIRYGVYGTATIGADTSVPVDIGATLIYQIRTSLRPGMVTSFPVGPVRIAGEAAVEAYDPRGQVMDYQPLWSLGAEYTWTGAKTDISLMGEYLYNGLAAHYPQTVFNDLSELSDFSVTSDYSGGFARPGYRYFSGEFTLSVVNRWATSHALLTNLSDKSTWVSHSLTLLRIPGVELEATVLWNSGDPETEFGDLQRDFVTELTAVVHF